MTSILNITNGDSAVHIMEEAGIPGIFLPWRDVLHDGPVPADLTLEELSEVRGQFIIGQGWGDHESIKRAFVERDELLRSFEDFDKLVLWFEHDLYDQLQILQILDWFSQHPSEQTELSIICTEQYLGMATPNEMKDLAQYETPITHDHLSLAREAWAAFRSDTPAKWRSLLDSDTSALPFLNGAIIRQLEEYPNCTNGLSRTAQQALQIISQGEKRPGYVFGSNQDLEARKFMGDSSFWVILHELLESEPALLELPPHEELTLPSRPDQELNITQAGKEVLSGGRNWLDMASIDRWIGGVHLTPDNLWCWNSDQKSIIRKAAES